MFYSMTLPAGANGTLIFSLPPHDAYSDRVTSFPVRAREPVLFILAVTYYRGAFSTAVLHECGDISGDLLL